MKKAILISAAAALCVTTPALAGKEHREQKAQYYFEQIDTNGDGKVTKSEHNAYGTKMFDEADTDNDGTLTLAEVKAQKQKMKQEYKSQRKDNHRDTDDSAM